MVYSAKTKLSAFVILLFIIQALFIGAGAFFDQSSLNLSLESGQVVIPRYIKRLVEKNQTEVKASYFSWKSDFSLRGVQEAMGLPTRYTVKKGDTLSKIWERLGANPLQAHSAAQALRSEGVSHASLRAGEELVLHINLEGDVALLQKELPEGKVLSLELHDGGYTPKIYNPKIVTTQRVVSGTIDHTLATSCLKEGIPYEVIDEFVDLFSGRVEFSRDPQPGDTFTIIFDERNVVDGRPLSPGVVHAASFMNRGELMVAIRHEGRDGEVHYYDKEGKPIGNHFLRYPVKFTRISSMFTNARFHPVLKSWRPHNGVDFAAPTGTPVRTVADGIVERAGYYGGNGNMVKIKHGDKYASAYVHLSRIAQGLRSGVRVKRGQVIGAVGSTGLATGPHLHYAFYINGQYVDPLSSKLPTVPDKFEPIPDQLLKATLKKLKRQHRQVQLAYSSKLAAHGENA